MPHVTFSIELSAAVPNLINSSSSLVLQLRLLQLADIQQFNSAEQHDLTQIFTLIMSGGILAAFLIGWLMDQVGLELCTTLILVLGQVQLVVVVWLAERRFFLVTSFVCYTLFRSFLFPVFIASVTTHLGYKYFGLLNGIGFALSGVAQAFIGVVVRAVRGTCHLQGWVTDVTATPSCDHGKWVSFHVLQLILLTILLAAPVLDNVEKVVRKRRLRQVLGSLRSLSSQLSNHESQSYRDDVPQYGTMDSVATTSEDQDDQEDHEIGMSLSDAYSL